MNLDLRKHQGMAQRNEITRLLSPHNGSQLSDRQNIPFLHRPTLNALKNIIIDGDKSLCYCNAMRMVLLGHIHHPRVALFIKMC